MTERYEALEGTLALIERGWTQGAFCRDAKRIPVTTEEPGFFEPEGKTYCALGALQVVCAGDDQLYEDCAALLDALAAEHFEAEMEEVNDGDVGERGVSRRTAFRYTKEILHQAIRVAKAAASVVLDEPVDAEEARRRQMALERIAGV